MMINNKILLLILATFIVQTLSKCFTNKETKSCLSSDVCYSHYYIHQEGFLEGFDCNSTSSLPQSDCIRILQNSSMGTSLCVIQNENERHCCCLSTESESICAAENRKTEEFFDLWNGLQVLYFFMAILMTSLVASLAHTFYDYAFNKWSKDNSDFTHENGRFFNPRTFLYTKFSDNMLNSVYFTINFVFCYFEYGLWKKYTSSKKINRTASITISLFIFLTIPLIIIQPIRETYQLLEKENEGGYCKLGYVMHILNFCHFLYILYDIIVLVHIREIFKLDKELMIESDIIEEVIENNLLSVEKAASTVETSQVSTENILEFEPRPFDVSRNSKSILKIKSNSKFQWIALRALLSTTGFYKIHPTKFLIPPGREISIEVSQISQNEKNEAAYQHNILIEWFFIGSVAPAIDVNKFWIRPYIVPQSNWNIFVLPIYLESAT
ncbi:unnamed protein product [Caenorhabditis angaria]|uniref:MSP domain-containing protein n=1 Tax=Caenorhabditis angaria TaxID=860376 RepID=A0A9P1MY74_9PELO|nr:unnamed protein product [Caenorhabditis angaria]